MLKYRQNVLDLLKNNGYTTYFLLKNKIISPQTVQDLRKNKMVGIKTLGTLCNLLQCQPGDIIAWAPDPEQDHTTDTNTSLE